MSNQDQYTPPEVWKWEQESGGTFASLNRPIAGATHDKKLPRGEHFLQLHSMGTPNGVKVTIMLEELLAAGHSDAEYDAWMIKIGEGDQFGSGFVEQNPNSKIPALLDYSGDGAPVRVFESASILMYLAEKFGTFIPEGQARVECFNWLFWQMGSAPYLGGGFGHFYAYAPFKMEYPINRFAMEVKRQMDVLDRHLAENEYLAGSQYSIADMATWPWYGRLAQGNAYNAGTFLDVQSYKNLQRWTNQIVKREAVIRGKIVNIASGQENAQLPERHSAADIDAVLAK